MVRKRKQLADANVQLRDEKAPSAPVHGFFGLQVDRQMTQSVARVDPGLNCVEPSLSGCECKPPLQMHPHGAALSPMPTHTASKGQGVARAHATPCAP